MSKAIQDEPAQKRNAPRKRVAVNARAEAVDGGWSIPCSIRDASPHGCRIHCSHAADLTEEFLLYPAGVAKPLKVKMKWRQGKWAGLFIDWEGVLYV